MKALLNYILNIKIYLSKQQIEFMKYEKFLGKKEGFGAREIVLYKSRLWLMN